MILFLGLLVFCPSVLSGQTTFSSDTNIGCSDFTYDGQDIIVDGAVLTIDCAHTFQNLTITNGGRVTRSAGQLSGMDLTIVQDLNIESGAAIDASVKGYLFDQGPGTASAFSGGGGAHGGAAENRIPGGHSYGSFKQPPDSGSGGASGLGANLGGPGGGLVKITVGDTLRVDGELLSEGGDGIDLNGGLAGVFGRTYKP